MTGSQQFGVLSGVSQTLAGRVALLPLLPLSLKALVEVKSGQTVAADFLTPIKRWQSLAGDVAGPAVLVYGGQVQQARTDCTVIPWRQLGLLEAPFRREID